MRTIRCAGCGATRPEAHFSTAVQISSRQACKHHEMMPTSFRYSFRSNGTYLRYFAGTSVTLPAGTTYTTSYSTLSLHSIIHDLINSWAQEITIDTVLPGTVCIQV